MNREGLVGKAWRTIASHGIDRHELAEDVVDALLPQVTTVDEALRLPDGAVLIGDGQRYPAVWSWNQPGDLRPVAEALLATGPLTVVWQP